MPARTLAVLAGPWGRRGLEGSTETDADLVKALTQASVYINEVEREINSQKFFARVGEVRTVKSRCVLVFGRSLGWNEEQRRSYRILNANYHNLSIMTYDHVLARAKRLLASRTATIRFCKGMNPKTRFHFEFPLKVLDYQCRVPMLI
jgi:hypothetical protein